MAISYTKLLLKHWESVQLTALGNITNINNRITVQQTSEEEWNFIQEVLEKITKQTKEDLERKPDRRGWNPNNQQAAQTLQQDQMEASTSFSPQNQPLPQRQRRTGGFRENCQ